MGSGGLFAKLLSCLLYLSIGKTFMHIEIGMVADFVTSFINSWTSRGLYNSGTSWGGVVSIKDDSMSYAYFRMVSFVCTCQKNIWKELRIFLGTR